MGALSTREFEHALRLVFPARRMLAFDRGSLRSFDADGRLHIGPTRISRACVSPYYGREIPRAAQLGLDPDRLYWLLRDPDELARAVDSFNRIPVLSDHRPVDAVDYKPELVIGCTGESSEFDGEWLYNSLVIWSQGAISAIESEQKRDLSFAYRYVPIMEPGVFRGQRFDGRMTKLAGNHVALVPDGRDPGAIIGDEAPEALLRKERLRWVL